jgi:hypothetical protein
MRMVRRILLIAVLGPVLLLIGCEDTRTVRELPISIPEPATPPEKREPQTSEGYLGDPATLIFHRIACPRCAEIDPRRQVFFPNPYDALNERYAPCEYCDPMVGWN